VLKKSALLGDGQPHKRKVPPERLCRETLVMPTDLAYGVVMETDLTIRTARPGDIAAMKTIWKAFIDFHLARDPFFERCADGHDRYGEFVAKHLKDEDWYILVAVVDNDVVGQGIGTVQYYPPVYVHGKFGYIQEVAVAEAYRRQGIGTALIEQMIAWFKHRGITRIEVEVATTNEVSNPFWRKAGFGDFTARLSKKID
jgi:ribosomal protein S18 acetylase RimI-like enzyme